MNHHDFDRRDDFGFDRDFRPGSYQCNPADCFADPEIREYFFEKVGRDPELRERVIKFKRGFEDKFIELEPLPEPEFDPDNPDLRPPSPESKPNP